MIELNKVEPLNWNKIPFWYQLKDDGTCYPWKEFNNLLTLNANKAGFIKGRYVLNTRTGKASIIKGFCTSTFVARDRQKYILCYLTSVYQDYVPVNNLKLLSAKGYDEFSYQREIESLEIKNRSLEDELDSYKIAFEKLRKNNRLDNTCCSFGPCIKSKLGICDGECDAPGS